MTEREEKPAALLFIDRDGFKRVNDTLGHAAGDELLCAIAQKIVDRVCKPCRLSSGKVSVSASIGVTRCPFDGKTVKELMVDADHAMYAAKAAGKNRFEFYTAEFAGTDSQGLYTPQLV